MLLDAIVREGLVLMLRIGVVFVLVKEFGKIYYICNVNGYDMVEECIANDDNIGCDLFVPDNDDDFTA